MKPFDLSLDYIARPYLRYAKTKKCIGCRKTISTAPGRSSFCEDCSRRRLIVSQVKTRLRLWQDTGNRVRLSQAVGLITKHGIKPKDLRII
jgi:DNA-directed RNA polymerase subunit RPC12/RpoP